MVFVILALTHLTLLASLSGHALLTRMISAITFCKCDGILQFNKFCAIFSTIDSAIFVFLLISISPVIDIYISYAKATSQTDLFFSLSNGVCSLSTSFMLNKAWSMTWLIWEKFCSLVGNVLLSRPVIKKNTACVWLPHAKTMFYCYGLRF